MDKEEKGCSTENSCPVTAFLWRKPRRPHAQVQTHQRQHPKPPPIDPNKQAEHNSDSNSDDYELRYALPSRHRSNSGVENTAMDPEAESRWLPCPLDPYTPHVPLHITFPLQCTTFSPTHGEVCVKESGEECGARG